MDKDQHRALGMHTRGCHPAPRDLPGFPKRLLSTGSNAKRLLPQAGPERPHISPSRAQRGPTYREGPVSETPEGTEAQDPGWHLHTLAVLSPWALVLFPLFL